MLLPVMVLLLTFAVPAPSSMPSKRFPCKVLPLIVVAVLPVPVLKMPWSLPEIVFPVMLLEAMKLRMPADWVAVIGLGPLGGGPDPVYSLPLIVLLLTVALAVPGLI